MHNHRSESADTRCPPKSSQKATKEALRGRAPPPKAAKDQPEDRRRGQYERRPAPPKKQPQARKCSHKATTGQRAAQNATNTWTKLAVWPMSVQHRPMLVQFRGKLCPMWALGPNSGDIWSAELVQNLADVDPDSCQVMPNLGQSNLKLASIAQNWAKVLRSWPNFCGNQANLAQLGKVGRIWPNLDKLGRIVVHIPTHVGRNLAQIRPNAVKSGKHGVKFLEVGRMWWPRCENEFEIASRNSFRPNPRADGGCRNELPNGLRSRRPRRPAKAQGQSASS